MIDKGIDYSKKNAEAATKFRLQGNKYFAQAITMADWEAVILQYTKSVAYAPTGSLELALAYANRSLTLYEMKLLPECLLDIGRALDTNYPDNLKSKLYFRRALCLRFLRTANDPATIEAFADARKWMDKMDGENKKLMKKKFEEIEKETFFF